ncbi:MAG: efflux RND transporter periplasmic adaptor subunit, partial [Planctomycetota bacterium]
MLRVHRATPRRVFPVLCFALMVLGIGASPLPAQGPPPAPVVVDAVVSEEVQEWRQVTGEVRVRHRARVAARESGPLVELTVREGERVEKGALLGKIEATRLEITRAQATADRALAEATLTEREAEATFAERDLAVLRDLENRGATNPKEILDAETALAVASARREQAKRQLAVIEQRTALIEKRLSDTEIRAPFAGTVVTRHAQAGEWHAAGQPVVTLISDRDLEVWLSVPQRYYAAFEDPRLAIEITTSVGR